MDKDLIKKINEFKKEIDPELAHLEISEFIEAVALTPQERKLAGSYIKELKELI